MLWFSKIDKSISYHFAAQKVLRILNLPRPVSNVSCSAHTKAFERKLQRAPRKKTQKRDATSQKTQAYFFCSLIQLEKWETPILLCYKCSLIDSESLIYFTFNLVDIILREGVT